MGLNGALNATGSITNLNPATSPVVIGQITGHTDDYINGDISFISIADVARSDNWIKTFNNSLTDNLITFDLDPNPVTTRVSHDIYINDVDIYQSEVVDISTVSGTINKIELKILNDDYDNTFYIDKMYLT
ncbi:MAG: hypothetical protein DRI84_05570 [Bacteroidetes bacterium]|nr:MAG: hypothetical protein DRI84_05570 [Bacteroidota bacterium]